MAKPILDFSKFSFSAEEIRAVSELVFDEVLKAPEIDFLHTVYPNIITVKEVGFVGEGGLVGVKNQGCDPQPQEWNIGSRVVKWTPEDWEILIHSCWTDLQGTAALYSLNTGTEIADFTSTDYMAIVVECLANSMKEFVIRYAWFNDKQAKNIADGGIITNDIEVKYFNIIDGFFKQIDHQLTINPNQLIEITENKGADRVAQIIDPSNIQKYLQKLVFGASILLRNQKDAVILCTQSFYDAYAMSLQGDKLETMYKNLTEGLGGLTYNGVTLVPFPVWDKIIQSYENTGGIDDELAKVNRPNRAIYISPSILGIGVDDISSFSDVDIWYDRDTRKVKMEAMGIADAKLLNPAMFKAAM